MSLSSPGSVEKLQKSLHEKAKLEPSFRFYSLYDKVYRQDVLVQAYRICKANQGSPGIDRKTFEAIESEGLDKWLGNLSEELRMKTFRLRDRLRFYRRSFHHRGFDARLASFAVAGIFKTDRLDHSGLNQRGTSSI